MDKKVLVVFMALLFVLPFGLAQASPAAKSISRLHLVGNGLAINAEDAMDFMHAKVSVGAVKIRNEDENSEEGFDVKRVGVLFLDGEKYVLRGLAVEEGEISGDVYAFEEDSSIGSFYVALHEKPGQDVWAGELSMNGVLYNIYFVGVKRNFKPAEMAEKVSNYCEENFEDEKCSKAVGQCKENPRACRAKVLNFCKDNPEDEKCIDLQSTYCLKNASDIRCREHLLERCREDPEQLFCKRTGDQNRLSIHPAAVRVVTAERGEDFNLPPKVKPVKNRWGPLVGGDKDKHGCIGSAGYKWCESTEKCFRSWEEECPLDEDDENSE